ncbi:unnamed protein product [Chrysoparadoxa australica]
MSRVFLGLGSNLGDRVRNLSIALSELRNLGVVKASSTIFETEPMGRTDQPHFLNAACEMHTTLRPGELLDSLKMIEEKQGRVNGERWGARTVDIDVLLWEDKVIKETSGAGRDVEVPHPRMLERGFVLHPLASIAPTAVHPVKRVSVKDALTQLPDQGVTEVMPVKGRLWKLNSKAYVMGVLNVTPDSFSDGGKYSKSVQDAVEHARVMLGQGADIIDVGAESTRPGASTIPCHAQIERAIPIIEAIAGSMDIPLSIDTRSAAVAQAAVTAGACIVNDVSGGTHDERMLSTVAQLQVPFLCMHMRGDPTSMASMTQYDDLIEDVIDSLKGRRDAAQAAGIPRFMQVMDPGIGFAKTGAQNLHLLHHLQRIRDEVGCPVLVGASRKKFIGEICGLSAASDRDWGTAGACVAAAERGASILRVHNVGGIKQSLQVLDAIRSAGIM